MCSSSHNSSSTVTVLIHNIRISSGSDRILIDMAFTLAVTATTATAVNTTIATAIIITIITTIINSAVVFVDTAGHTLVMARSSSIGSSTCGSAWIGYTVTYYGVCLGVTE